MYNGNMTKETLEKCKKERDEYLNGWKRALADLENYRKEESLRLRRAQSAGKEAVINELTPVFDSFEQSGEKVIYSQFAKALEKHGVEEISPKKGEEFDSNYHEAMGEIESDEPEGTIAKVERKGYKFGDKVLRPAQVFITKSKETKKS